jgi:hypothetical protein
MTKIFSNAKFATMSLEQWLKDECLDNDKISVIKSKELTVLQNMEGQQFMVSCDSKPKEPKPRTSRKGASGKKESEGLPA